MKPRTLSDVVRDLASYDAEATIYAVEPWIEDSPAWVEHESGDGDVPLDIAHLGGKYFMEVFIAQEFLTDWAVAMDPAPSIQASCRRLIQYAINDA